MTLYIYIRDLYTICVLHVVMQEVWGEAQNHAMQYPVYMALLNFYEQNEIVYTMCYNNNYL